jgi:putative tricarboxylic transport membrane protein
MLETLSYLSFLADPYVLLVMSLGTLAGIFLGAMPGVSPTMAVALLVPMTFYMDPRTGLILLGTVYSSAVAGGGITAILINVPGAPASIATLIDGYPMAKKGKAWEALCITFWYSMIGGIIGVLAMIWFTPILAEFAMNFGPAQLFWVTIFGITIISGLSGGNVVKGLFVGLFGMLISCIGYSPMLGEPRYVFHDCLTSGIAIVPVLVGMFAIPQVLDLAENLHNLSGENRLRLMEQARSGGARPKGTLLKIILNIRHWWKTVLCGLGMGLSIGVIPGVGANAVGLIAYDYSKKMSTNPDDWGKGEPQGVVASETANNTTVGPALIPLLTLGVPGSPTAAALLGGLLIHGLFPGPDLFTKHREITLTFMAGLLAAQVFMCAGGLLISRYSQHITKVPALIMIAAVSVCAVVGAYGVQNSMDDVIIMLGLGLMTFTLLKLDFPVAPMVLGVVLGPIAEENFLRGKLIAEAGDGMFQFFFTGNLNLVFIVICALSIIWGIFVEYRSYKRNIAAEAEVAS